MKFDALDRRMRSFETSLDQYAPIDHLLVARIDGRGFTRLTKQVLDWERPFDPRFHDAMQRVCEHLMRAGLKVALCYTQSDEISLLLDRGEDAFNRKTRKLNSLLAGEASGVFSLAIGRPAAFDCRICPLPTVDDTVDYFRWRCEDARRNALSAFCYWGLRARGIAPSEADRRLAGLSPDAKRGLLRELGCDFDSQNEWERLGAMLIWETVQHGGCNPVTGATEQALRRRLRWLSPMPQGGDIDPLVRRLTD